MRGSIVLAGLGLALGALVGLGGCGSDTESADGAGGGTSVDGCAQAVAALCAKYEACVQAFLVVGYGDAATCKERLAPACAASLAAPGANATNESLASCAGKVDAASCDQLFDGSEICEPVPGSLADGKACGTDGQCKSSHCKVAGDAACGVCAARVTAGGSCAADTEGCAAGLVCATNGTCAAPVAAGGACATDKPCQVPLGCVAGTCAKLPGPGDACDPTTKPCEFFAKASLCNPSTQLCQEVTFADAGEPCGVVGGMTFVGCAKNGSCKSPMGMMEGICEPAAADGAACDMDKSCLAPAKCVSGSCQLTDPAACK